MIRQIGESWEIHVDDFLSVSTLMASRTSLLLSQALAYSRPPSGSVIRSVGCLAL